MDDNAYLWPDGYYRTTPPDTSSAAYQQMLTDVFAERDRLRDQNADLLGQLDAVVFAHNVMQGNLNRLREALEHYANKRNWHRNPSGQLCNFHKDRNGPYIAVAALQEAGDE